VAHEQPSRTKGQRAQNEARPAARTKEQPPARSPSGRSLPLLIVAVVALLVVIGRTLYWHSTYYEDTDDAQIAGHIDQLSPRINGQIIAVDM
jgi:membrane fusion protein (multidrug efflux system)